MYLATSSTHKKAYNTVEKKNAHWTEQTTEKNLAFLFIVNKSFQSVNKNINEIILSFASTLGLYGDSMTKRLH